MNRIYSRREIIYLFYTEYSEASKDIGDIMNRIVLHMLRWSEDDFIEYCNSMFPFKLERIRKNTYYLR